MLPSISNFANTRFMISRTDLVVSLSPRQWLLSLRNSAPLRNRYQFRYSRSTRTVEGCKWIGSLSSRPLPRINAVLFRRSISPTSNRTTSICRSPWNKKRATSALNLKFCGVGGKSEQYRCNFPMSASCKPSLRCSRLCVNPRTWSVIFCGIKFNRCNPSKKRFSPQSGICFWSIRWMCRYQLNTVYNPNKNCGWCRVFSAYRIKCVIRTRYSLRVASVTSSAPNTSFFSNSNRFDRIISFVM